MSPSSCSWLAAAAVLAAVFAAAAVAPAAAAADDLAAVAGEGQGEFSSFIFCIAQTDLKMQLRNPVVSSSSR